MQEKFKDAKGMFYQRLKISDNIETEKETGFLYCKNSILGHVGVQQYNGNEIGIDNADVVDVIREPNDVFDEDSLASMDGKPITLYHPEEMVTSENFKKYAVGFIRNVHREDDLIIGDLVINDMDAIERVLSGEIKDLSLGYQAKLVPTGDGRLKQTNIVINHLAIVPEGRAEFARIVDENRVIKEMKGENKKMGLFSKKEEEVVQDSPEVEETMEAKDEETMPRELGIQPHEPMQDAEEEEEMVEDEKESDEEHLEKEIGMKDYQHFMNQYKEIKDMPAGDFKTKAYDQANKECMSALGVSLPMMDSKPKASVIEKSVGLADNLTVEEQTLVKKEPKLDAKAEERFYDRLYRSFDHKASNPQEGKTNARKYGDMTYRDIIDELDKKGGIK
jgi:hypothetical protein